MGREIPEDEDNNSLIYDESLESDDWTRNMVLDKIIDGVAQETTGKFGTGFLTTHLLSKTVWISGVY